MPKSNIKPNSKLARLRITEKAAIAAGTRNVYTFEVEKSATKKEIAASVKNLYKVTPVKVATLPIPKKAVFIRGKWGTKSGGKKAYVYLRKEDKIELV